MALDGTILGKVFIGSMFYKILEHSYMHCNDDKKSLMYVDF